MPKLVRIKEDPMSRPRFLSLGAAFLAAVLLVSQPVPAAQERSPKERTIIHPKLEVVLSDFPAGGLILDIGEGERASSAN